MSFRSTFVTDFIYSAGEAKETAQVLNKLFEENSDNLVSKLDGRGYGYFAGRYRTLSGTFYELTNDIEGFLEELRKATKVPFRITYMLESNAVITYDINPRV